MSWIQTTVTLQSRPRGFHLITDEVARQVPQIREFEVGLAHIFIQHTSASLAINENAAPDVRRDMESYFNRTVPDDAPYFLHTDEGSDDMPAHIKSVLLGSSLTLPITDGQLALGIWQGLYLCEHRDQGGPRSLVITLSGQHRDDPTR